MISFYQAELVNRKTTQVKVLKQHSARAGLSTRRTHQVKALLQRMEGKR